ncbi:hypothetical protein A3D70_00465 [Candidatus Adlerbacteria bacterium RIFCSPHIGHO2_02_FULL_54_18]|uniref:Blue (type 1) copper domain-containing protein n=2 Tax=Candidatus Adleribacteriota TaxID=1752736 RepID=A0A1F4Y1L3_9BACT|nr:MAG: hypothetical protein A2949_02725 [Candidatus Adlerbacteria bacterium RIFCSPLOWO2_01_FULL_54_21b]OGC87754.1 MAG: hypothetical protein A3D70_00465 [Candidatus Adlerbacteria bacterium RIFCSPHIGHO2_02_FULL_54_18]
MNSSGWAAVVAAVVLIAGVAWWYTAKAPTAPAGDAVSAETPVSGSTASEPKTVTVNYSDAGFSPATITIKRGDTVTFTNSSSGSMWVASAPHPAHTAYAGTALSEHCPAGSALAFDQCQTGASYSFKFDKAGTWKYHNHSNAGSFGEVIVAE